MKPLEVVEAIKQEHPDLLVGITNKNAVALVRAVYEQLGNTLDAAEPGLVKWPGLGNFRIREIDMEVEGQKAVRRQIVFGRPAAKVPSGS